MKNIVDKIDDWLDKYRDIILDKKVKPIEELRQIALDEYKANPIDALLGKDEEYRKGYKAALKDCKDCPILAESKPDVLLAENTTHPFRFNGDYEAVLDWVKTKEDLTVSGLQRKFNLGYNKASDLVNRLKACGIVEGNDKRGYYKVILSK